MSVVQDMVGAAASPHWGRIPAVTVIGKARLAGNTVLLETDAGPVWLTLHAFGARLRTGERAIGGYGLLAAEPAALTPTLEAKDDRTVITAGGLALALDHAPLSFTLTQADGRVVQSSPTDGHFVRRFRLPPFAKLDGAWFVSLDLRSGEPVYGLGEKWGQLDHRGQLLRSRNEDALGVNGQWSYKNTPFAWSPEGWGLLVHTPSPVTHGVGYAPWSQRAYGLVVEDDHLDLFLFAGGDGPALLEQYTGLTGRAPVPPLWSLGVILSKAYYRTPEEVIAVATEVRAKGMPCDTITFDGRAWQDTDTRFAFEWDPKRFRDPAATLATLKAMDFKICAWEYPLVSVNNPLFDELAAKGWLLKDRRTGEAYRYQWDLEPFGPVLTPLPDSGLIDFTHPDAYAYWRDCHKPLFDAGVDMIKADFGEQVEPDMLASNGETGHALHNVYAHLYNRCVYEAAQTYCPSGPFLFSRASWIGAQRYPAQWGGDPQADWEGMAGNLRGGLSWGLSGAPYYATDVGGFYRDQRDPVLYVRWAQAAVFSAHMRLHGIGPREPWSYGPEAEAATLAALKLRYRLIPYLHAVMETAAATGLPVQRAMALACPDDRAAWAFEDQFFCGPDLLVAPCLNPAGTVTVYLPAGQWHRFPDGAALEGGRAHTLTLALDEMAVFARAGARIPLGPEVEHTGALGGRPVVAGYWTTG
ncbi:glycoside hydrolase, family 31 [Nitrospirillum viridazoti Y2]|uniref:Alpha-D-xyloside xylohydrolase n=1 Tax=Nitrospirillum amazonense TaxID=28077 RepID=A0A560HP35_9PROT|nr:alpha-xylosidase [Nitrospirillum amazonense]EGY00713.1 glycoside hydrolase, family 31 [Nitrospirillum amazonense Y2]TWB48215.1 alpha-D-xyloside xylohydrolase [Nitrospirillum amazonense]